MGTGSNRHPFFFFKIIFSGSTKRFPVYFSTTFYCIDRRASDSLNFFPLLWVVLVIQIKGKNRHSESFAARTDEAKRKYGAAWPRSLHSCPLQCSEESILRHLGPQTAKTLEYLCIQEISKEEELAPSKSHEEWLDSKNKARRDRNFDTGMMHWQKGLQIEHSSFWEGKIVSQMYRIR